MKRIIIFSLIAGFTLITISCSSSANQSQTNEPSQTQINISEIAVQTSENIVAEETTPAAVADKKIVASDRANIQTSNPNMPTRVIENGTKINMRFGDVVIPGILNDSQTAKALIEMLPYTVNMSSYSHDFCGVMPDELPYSDEEVHYGWLNGDIDYAIDAPYFTILHSDEDISKQYGYQVNIGVIDCELEKIRELSGNYDVLIELAELGVK